MTKATLATTAAMTAGNALTSLNNTGNGSGLGGILKSLYNAKPQNAKYSIDGNTITTRKQTKNGTNINYELSDDEKALLDYTNKNLLNGLENINVFSDDLQKNINQQLEAYKTKGMREINETYTPMFRELKNDIASRFGNLDNSIFLNNLNEIEKNRTNAIATLTENILAKQNELYEAEMENRYNYLNTLTNTNESIYSKILNYLQLTGA